MAMNREIVWLAVLTVLAYEVVKVLIPPRIFGGALSPMASAAWGS